jgi:2-keto-3-deoxy-L-rhamnonate aldolase RhmA
MAKKAKAKPLTMSVPSAKPLAGEDMTTLICNWTRAILDSGRMSIMTSVRQTRAVDVVMAIKAGGFDAMFVDLEHGGLNMTEAGQLCVAGLTTGVTPFVRIPGHEPYLAGQVLDLGAMGVVVPHVDTAADARLMVDACLYPPVGHRGFSSTVPQLRYLNWPAAEVRAHINSQTTIMAQIETRKAVKNIEAIAAVDGIDIVLVGANDLLLDMGIPGQHGHDKLLKALEKIAKGCRNQGKHCGIGGVPGPFSLIQEIYGMGFRLMSVGADTNLLANAFKTAGAEMRRLEA